MVHSRTRREQELVASEVTRGTYFFLDVVARSRGAVRVALGGREQCGENYRVQRASYPFPTLELVVDGEGRINYDSGPSRAVRPGSLFAHGPGVNIRIESTPRTGLMKYFVCFTGHGARALMERHAPVFGKLITLEHHGEIRELFDLMIREGARQTTFSRALCDQLGQLLLLKIADSRKNRGVGRGQRESRARERFLRCKALIDAEGERFSSLEEIAGALHADPSGLSRLFRRYQGVSPYQYLLRHKMNLAARDLIRSGGFVKEVAARAGYADAYHFSRLFKAVHGIAPAHFPRFSKNDRLAATR